MSAAGEGQRLPRSIGGVVGFALRTVAARAPLYAALSLGVFVAGAIAELAVPAADAATPLGEFKGYVLAYTGLFVDAYVVAATALGVAARASGIEASPRALLTGAVERWLPVIAVTLLAQLLTGLTSAYSGFTAPPEPHALVYVFAPITWMLWAILGLAGPFVALGSERALFLVLGGFGRAFTVSLRRTNLLRLAVLALIAIVPNVIQAAAFYVMTQHHIPRPLFWSTFPVDALTLVPVTAVQTAFALDFVRRAGLSAPPPET